MVEKQNSEKSEIGSNTMHLCAVNAGKHPYIILKHVARYGAQSGFGTAVQERRSRMAEYIERKTLVERLTRNLNACNPGKFYEMCYQDAINTATAFPAADVAPVRHGRWINAYIRGQHHYRCSGCGEYTEATWHSNFVYNYCPNCGAKMDLEG